MKLSWIHVAFTATVTCLAIPSTQAFAGMNQPRNVHVGTKPDANLSTTTTTTTTTTRRDSFSNMATIIGGVLATTTATITPPASAIPTDETPRVVARMGGLLDRYADTQRGVSLLVPATWNKFEGEVGAYDLKWQDIVDPRENVKISSTPVKSTTTSVSVLGDNVEEIGQKLAAKRNAKLVNAYEKLTDGILFYIFEFAINDGTHQLLSLSVNKGKIWSLDCNTTEKRWEKRGEMYYNIVGSFLPKL